jgi:hypothetical protein
MTKPVSWQRAEAKLKEADSKLERGKEDLRQIAKEVIKGILSAYVHKDQKWLMITDTNIGSHINDVEAHVAAMALEEQLVKEVFISEPMKRKTSVLLSRWNRFESTAQEHAELRLTFEYGRDTTATKATKVQPIWDAVNELQGIAMMAQDGEVLGVIPRDTSMWPLFQPELNMSKD